MLLARDERDPGGDAGEEEPGVDELLAGIRDRPSADQLLQLREGDHRAGERDRSDQCREHDRDADVDLRCAGFGKDPVQLGERDERCRAAADAVEQRHHLRHRGHLHLARRDGTEAAADHHAERDRPVAHEPLWANVTAIATSIPAAPIWLPRRAWPGARGSAARG